MKRRVRMEFTFGSIADRDLAATAVRNTLGAASLFDMPVDVTASTNPVNGNPTLVFDARFNTTTDATLFYTKMSSVLTDPTVIPLGILPVGKSFEFPTQFIGHVSVHDCPHEEARTGYLPCSTQNFTVTAKT